MSEIMMSTMDSVPGRTVLDTIGLVDGSSVVSPGFARAFSGGLAAISGGQVTEFEELMVKARALARKEMIGKARNAGAHAILGLRYATCEIGNGLAEMIVYGTAVMLD